MTGKTKMRDFIDNFVTRIQQTRDVSKERGNVLFLILIAVALFAALSYAVTSSSRSGGGDASSETNLVSSASVTQYPATIRTSLIRMLIGGYTVEEIFFDPPADFGANLTTIALQKRGIFHPLGGGATFVNAGSDLSAAGTKQAWIFNSRYQVLNVGTDAADNGANELIAFLPGIKKGICKKINDQLGISGVGVTLSDDTDANGIPDAGVVIANVPIATMNQDFGASGIGAYNAGFVIGHATNGEDFTGEPFGCADFNDVTTGNDLPGDFVYYHVITER